MKALYLLRHAETEPPGGAGSDFERPLSAAGVATARRVADAMAARGWRPEAVLCSAAHRAIQTWQAMTPMLAPNVAPRILRGLYLAPPSRLLAALRRQPDNRASVLLIGHNPGIQSLAQALAGPASAAAAMARLRTPYPPAALSVLDLAIGDWRALGPG
ncbi:MAG TPA: histidine phosphatase family protein, partial [Kiloniellales bacterium]